MKTILLLLITLSVFSCPTLRAQETIDSAFFIRLSEVDSLEKDLIHYHRNPLNFNKLDSANQLQPLAPLQPDKKDSVVAIRFALQENYRELLTFLFQSELEQIDYNASGIKNSTAFYIQHITDINQLQWLFMLSTEQVIPNSERYPVNFQILLKRNLQQALSDQITALSKHELCLYSYNTLSKQLLKGVLLTTSNDLFSFRNFDMDYTGGVKIGILTDYLKMNRYRPVKSYQTVFFGADVYTPYFRDTALFNADTSYNRFDRPHASFQYFGLESNALSRNFRFRWNIQLKLGKIGGNKAKSLQSALHQDISKSPRPQGWGAQISNKGRLGFSLEYKPEYLLVKKNTTVHNTRFWGSFPSVTGDVSFGSFMTHAGVGIQWSNKNFYSTNQDYMMVKKSTYSSKRWNLRYLSVTANANLKYVFYNTMLQGYGILKSFEKNSDDAFAPVSLHTFDKNELQPIVYQGNLTFSLQTRYFNVFYRFSIKSPELKPITDPATGSDYIVVTEDNQRLNIYTRWHQYGTIGILFRVGG
jgi:hypothetical protein